MSPVIVTVSSGLVGWETISQLLVLPVVSDNISKARQTSRIRELTFAQRLPLDRCIDDHFFHAGRGQRTLLSRTRGPVHIVETRRPVPRRRNAQSSVHFMRRAVDEESGGQCVQLVELVFNTDFGLGGSLAAPKRRVERCDLDATGELNLRRSFRP